MTPPTVLAVLSPPSRRQTAWTWRIPECPYCHKPHTHGAGVDGTVDGHRVSHCADGNDNPGYVIRKAGLQRRHAAKLARIRAADVTFSDNRNER